ncbi:MAG: prohibitin family protein [Bacteroidetes bacterium]|nr:MAG: prohibitin family protein [Bacteroidota bacterium]
MNKSRVISTAALVFLGFLLLVFLTSGAFITIDAGERGVIFRKFGSGLDKENIFQPGFHFIAPWNSMYVYSVRETQLEEEMEVLSSNGLNIKVDVTARVNPMYNRIGDLHENFGKDYLISLVRPELRSSVRKILGRFTPEELYSTRRDEVQEQIQKDLEETLGKNFIELKASLIRDIELPEKVKTAIEEKLEAEQSALKYEYILEQERKEAERRIIEAKAKAEANRVLNASLTDKILQDKGIEATLELANSPNSKVIIVGSGDSGLPLILGNN